MLVVTFLCYEATTRKLVKERVSPVLILIDFDKNPFVAEVHDSCGAIMGELSFTFGTSNPSFGAARLSLRCLLLPRMMLVLSL